MLREVLGEMTKTNNQLLIDKLEDSIDFFIEQVNTKEARTGLLHARKIMDMIIFHSKIQENKYKLFKEWDTE